MKKTFLFLLSFLFLFSLFPQKIANAEGEGNYIRLLRVINGQTNSFIYLFPINTNEFKSVEIDGTMIEGFKYFLKARVDVLAKGYSDQTDKIDGAEVSEVKYYESFDALGFTLSFENLSSYQEFFGGGSGEKNSEKSGLFIVKTVYKTAFPFSSSVAKTFDLMFSVTLSQWAETFAVDVQKLQYLQQVFKNVSYVYEIISTQKGIYSENMTKSGNLHYNIFVKTAKELEEDNQIVFWTKKINYGWWYFTALSSVLIFTILTLFIAKHRKKEKNF